MKRETELFKCVADVLDLDVIAQRIPVVVHPIGPVTFYYREINRNQEWVEACLGVWIHGRLLGQEDRASPEYRLHLHMLEERAEVVRYRDSGTGWRDDRAVEPDNRMARWLFAKKAAMFLVGVKSYQYRLTPQHRPGPDWPVPQIWRSEGQTI